MTVKCAYCGSERFYLNRIYKGREYYDIESVEADDETGVFVVVDASQARGDEYVDIIEESIHCNECEKVLSTTGKHRTWEEMSFELEWK